MDRLRQFIGGDIHDIGSNQRLIRSWDNGLVRSVVMLDRIEINKEQCWYKNSELQKFANRLSKGLGRPIKDIITKGHKFNQIDIFNCIDQFELVKDTSNYNETLAKRSLCKLLKRWVPGMFLQKVKGQTDKDIIIDSTDYMLGKDGSTEQFRQMMDSELLDSTE